MSFTVEYWFYNDVLHKFMEEEATVKKLKLKFKGEIPKEDFTEFTKTTQKWSGYAHDKELWYPIAIFKDEVLYAYISYGSEFIQVYFLDERMFEYVFMSYKKMDKEKMFLSTVVVREYMYKEKASLADLKKEITMLFSPEGNLKVTTENIIREPSVKIEREIEEAAHPVNVSQNWKDIPKYGHYEDILKL